MRLWVNGVLIIDNWTAHTAVNNTSAVVNLVGGQRYPIRVEYFENTGAAVMRLRWRLPGTTSYLAVPSQNLYPD